MEETMEDVLGFGGEIMKYVSVASIVSVLIKIILCVIVVIVASILISIFNKAYL